MTDFVRTRTELECSIADLRAANTNAGGKRHELELELAQINTRISAKEALLAELIPEWSEQRALEAMEKRSLDEASARLAALFAKQGRASKFRTKGERDAFLKHEIASVKAYQNVQKTALATTETELETARRNLGEIDAQIGDVQNKIEDSKRRAREITDQFGGLKEQQNELVERRKELWREDTKLDSLVGRAADELKTAERMLAGMMDKVFILSLVILPIRFLILSSKDTGTGLRAVDNIADRYNLKGVYGPLYRLFEVSDPKFNIAVELTAGNRYDPNNFTFLSVLNRAIAYSTLLSTLTTLPRRSWTP